MKEPEKNPFCTDTFFAAALFSYANEIYWENPEVISSKDARFHKTASGGNTAAAVWHEFIKQMMKRNCISFSCCNR